MSIIPKIMLEMMSQHLEAMTTKERLEFIMSMIDSMLEKSCNNMSEDEKNDFMSKIYRNMG